MHRDSSIVTGTSTRWVTRPCLLLSSGGFGACRRVVGAPQMAAHGEPVASEADELQVHRPAVGQMGEPLDHQQRGAARAPASTAAVCGSALTASSVSSADAQRLPGDPFDQHEDVVVRQVGVEQRLADVADEVGEVERERQRR